MQPLSLVFDSTGLYYDPTAPSDIETMLATAELSEEDIERARILRHRIVAGKITKYNVAVGADRLRTFRSAGL